jgi:hypothetical protein
MWWKSLDDWNIVRLPYGQYVKVYLERWSHAAKKDTENNRGLFSF